MRLLLSYLAAIGTTLIFMLRLIATQPPVDEEAQGSV